MRASRDAPAAESCCLLLGTIPNWELSLRVAFTVFALCMVTAAVFVQQVTAAKPACWNAPLNVSGKPGYGDVRSLPRITKLCQTALRVI